MYIVCGLNHKTAPVDVREKVALPVETHHTVLNRLVGLSAINEAAILSTCNRTEIYCHTEDTNALLPWLAKEQGLPIETLAPHFYLHTGHSGIRHTLRVASGLDSMMLGEPQIFGQMKQAYQSACEAKTIQSRLRPIFEFIFNASKRIRNNSGIGNNPVSVAFAAAQLIGQRFADLSTLNVLLIGSGEMSSLVAKYLHKEGVRQFMVASRSAEKASLLAESFSGKALTINDLPQHLPQADVVITATACPLPFITKHMVHQAMNARQHAPMFLLDLAVPRDIEQDVHELERIHLYNIDDLKILTEKGMDERRSAARHAEKLVDYELENFIRWRRSLQANEIICDYRGMMQELAQKELQRAQQKLEAGRCHHQVLSEFSERLVNKLTHQPTIGLRQAALDDRKDLLDLAQYLFNASSELPSL